MSASWWQATRRTLFRTRNNEAGTLPVPAGDVVDRLLQTLSPAARAMLVNRLGWEQARPRTVDDVLHLAERWAVGAGIAEGRGGYPGGSNAPGWSQYVVEQRSFLTIYGAACALSADGSGARRDYFRSLDERFTPSRRLMGDGYEPHVDEEAGRLLYGLPVDSGAVSSAFSFDIRQADVDVLLSDPYRRAVLGVVAHTILQRCMIPGSRPVTEMDFAAIVSSVLHSTPEELRRFIATVDREHNIDTGVFVAQAMARRP
ncbi:MAG TPA: hypothetical protein VGC15_00380 [Acetobacteraceae bacterium]